MRLMSLTKITCKHKISAHKTDYFWTPPFCKMKHCQGWEALFLLKTKYVGMCWNGM